MCAAGNRIPEALQFNKRVSQIEPDNAICHLNIGLCSARLRRFADAEEAFRKVIELTPDSSNGYRELALLYLKAGRKLPEAGRLAEKCALSQRRGLEIYRRHKRGKCGRHRIRLRGSRWRLR